MHVFAGAPLDTTEQSDLGHQWWLYCYQRAALMQMHAVRDMFNIHAKTVFMRSQTSIDEEKASAVQHELSLYMCTSTACLYIHIYIYIYIYICIVSLGRSYPKHLTKHTLGHLEQVGTANDAVTHNTSPCSLHIVFTVFA